MKSIFRLFILLGFIFAIPGLRSFSQGIYIGEHVGGGIIFYIDGTGQQGLIAADIDQSTGAQWGCNGTLIGTWTAIGTGQANTTAIVNNVCSTEGIAARLCHDLVLNGYSDWFLPSQDELNQMYAENSYLGMLGWYWSSSEDCPDGARAQNFPGGAQEGFGRNNACHVRAVRAFCIILDNPVEGTNIPSVTQIIWNWNTVFGATGYKGNTTNDYASALDLGTVTSFTETGLTCNTVYTRYVWAYNNCGNSTSTTLSQTTLSSLFYIGENYGGGIIFYIDETCQQGLIAATSDQSTGAEWGCYGTSTGATGTAIGTGQTNTTAIVNSGCSTTGIAAQICDDLVLNGYNDWFLPSQDELNQMYDQQTVVGSFDSGNYWSSSEYDAYNAFGQDFTSGGLVAIGKDGTSHVRAVRSFSCIIPGTPSAGTNIPGVSQIIWKWNTVSGTTGYKWNTINDYTSATDMGNSTTKTETGLTCNTDYTRYVWAYNNCGNSAVTTLSQTTLSSLFYIGEYIGGGVIFYIDETCQHGLIAATSDQSTGAQWGCYGTLIGTWTVIGMGQTNTTAIVNNGCSTTGIAVQICDDLVLNSYNDWFLPSKDELNLMYQQKSVIGNFTDNSYWSSSEYVDVPGNNAGYAWYDYFGNGSHGGASKSGAYYVRAVRAFGCTTPVTPDAGTQIPSLTQIIWNWNTVPWATGYKWNTINDYASATDMGLATTKTETGLTGNTAYTRYAWAYSACGNSAPVTLTSQTIPFSIGQTYGGGIIFYIDGTGQHGLIAAGSDQSTGTQWGCNETLLGASGTAIGTGQANTTAIVTNCSTIGIAAQICDALVLNDYSDWFLPSKDELNQMFIQQTIIGGFASNYYWSSSEWGSLSAWGQDFISGDQTHTPRSHGIHYVRAVRAF